MKTSEAGRAFIKREEGLRLRVYSDVAGYGSIGYGHLLTPDDDIGPTISQEEADELFASDVLRIEQGVNKLVTVFLDQHEYDAIVSFTFNLGVGSLKRSTLLKRLNSGDKAAAAAQGLRWVFAGDQDGDGDVDFNDRVKGLVRRRSAEQRLFEFGDYGA